MCKRAINHVKRSFLRSKRQPASVHRVFDTTELLEAILKNVPPLELFKLPRVNRQFYDIILGSRALQDIRLSAVLKPLETPPSESDRATDISFARLFHTPFSPLSERLRLRHLVIEPFKFDMLANGGGRLRSGDKQLPELHFSLDFRIAKGTRHVEAPVRDFTIEGVPVGPQHPRLIMVISLLKSWMAEQDKIDVERDDGIIGYRGKTKTHPHDQTWSYMRMTKDRQPFDVVVWVVLEDRNFYKHLVRFGMGISTMRDLFDVLTDVLDRSMERHENEAQLATLHGRC